MFYLNKIIESIKNRQPANWLFVLCVLFFCYLTAKQGPQISLAFASIPLVLIVCTLLIKHPLIMFFTMFTVNYFVMGVNRYISIQSGVVMDFLFSLSLALLLIMSNREKVHWERVRNPLTAITLIWLIFCCLELINPNFNDFKYWLIAVRPLAIYPLLIAILVSVVIKKESYINILIIFWGAFTILGALKGYWQKNHGFDSTEIVWLYSGGARTHLLTTGIRFFSFFTDAGNFGSTMGFSMVVMSITAIFTKNKWLKIFLYIAAAAACYGMVISGTRGALAVPFAGYSLFVILSKKWKLAVYSFSIILLSFIFLNYSNIGDDNRFIHRMRSAFDPNDASLQVRFNNQKMMKVYMKDLPFGTGIGATAESVNETHKLRPLAAVPKDSWFVRVWVYTGVFGISLYIILLAATIIGGSYIILFKIKDERLRGVLAGMLSGTFGMMASAYGNEIFTQFPNCILIYACQTLVFLGPYFDKEIENKKRLLS